MKVNIAVISNDISSLFKLIAYRLNKTLADFINLIKLFDAKSLDAEELKKFDVILNATEVNLRFDKPTLKIQPSLSENDLHILRLMLNNLNEKFHLDKLIRPELYLEISASSRQEALMKQIEHIRKSLPLPADFYDSVAARERMGTTEYNNKIAIPDVYKRQAQHRQRQIRTPAQNRIRYAQPGLCRMKQAVQSIHAQLTADQHRQAEGVHCLPEEKDEQASGQTDSGDQTAGQRHRAVNREAGDQR